MLQPRMLQPIALALTATRRRTPYARCTTPRSAPAAMEIITSRMTSASQTPALALTASTRRTLYAQCTTPRSAPAALEIITSRVTSASRCGINGTAHAHTPATHPRAQLPQQAATIPPRTPVRIHSMHPQQRSGCCHHDNSYSGTWDEMFDVYVQVNDGWVLGGEDEVCNAVCASQTGNKVCNPAKQSSLTTRTAVEQAMSAAGQSCNGWGGLYNLPGAPYLENGNYCMGFSAESDASFVAHGYPSISMSSCTANSIRSATSSNNRPLCNCIDADA